MDFSPCFDLINSSYRREIDRCRDIVLFNISRIRNDFISMTDFNCDNHFHIPKNEDGESMIHSVIENAIENGIFYLNPCAYYDVGVAINFKKDAERLGLYVLFSSFEMVIFENGISFHLKVYTDPCDCDLVSDLLFSLKRGGVRDFDETYRIIKSGGFKFFISLCHPGIPVCDDTELQRSTSVSWFSYEEMIAVESYHRFVDASTRSFWNDFIFKTKDVFYDLGSDNTFYLKEDRLGCVNTGGSGVQKLYSYMGNVFSKSHKRSFVDSLSKKSFSDALISLLRFASLFPSSHDLDEMVDDLFDDVYLNFESDKKFDSVELLDDLFDKGLYDEMCSCNLVSEDERELVRSCVLFIEGKGNGVLLDRIALINSPLLISCFTAGVISFRDSNYYEAMMHFKNIFDLKPKCLDVFVYMKKCVSSCNELKPLFEEICYFKNISMSKNHFSELCNRNLDDDSLNDFYYYLSTYKLLDVRVSEFLKFLIKRESLDSKMNNKDSFVDEGDVMKKLSFYFDKVGDGFYSKRFFEIYGSSS